MWLGEKMSLDGKIIGILFLKGIYIKEEFIYEIKRLCNIEKSSVITIIENDNKNLIINKKNCEKYKNELEIITNFKPIFINRCEIIENLIKKVDILILVRLNSKLIYDLKDKKTDTLILDFINRYKITNKPILLGIDIDSKKSIFESLKVVEALYKKENFYFIPFRAANPLTKPNRILFMPEFIIKTCYYALSGKQIEPIISFL